MVVKMGLDDAWLFHGRVYQTLATTPPLEVHSYDLEDSFAFSRDGFPVGISTAAAWREGSRVRFAAASISGTVYGLPQSACSADVVPVFDEQLNWLSLFDSYQALLTALAAHNLPAMTTILNLEVIHPWFTVQMYQPSQDLLAAAGLKAEQGLVQLKVSSSGLLQQEGRKYAFIAAKYRIEVEQLVPYSAFLVGTQLNLEPLYFLAGYDSSAVLLLDSDKKTWLSGPAHRLYT